jgi:hypothetical protein
VTRPRQEPRPEDLVTLENVQIQELLTDSRGFRYFEVDYQGTILKVRVFDRPDTVEAIEAHLNVPLDVIIFPAIWGLTSSGKSGVTNYYINAKLHQGE